jgi:tRNA (cmo5U34)-methyltransferase
MGMSDEPWQFHFDPATYLDAVRAELPDYDELQDRTAQATEGINARSILDLGVGTGETIARVVQLHPSAHVVGIDENPEMLEVARQRLPEADFLVGRLEDPLPVGSFDLVVSALAVHHLDSQGKADLFQRVAQCLAPAGRFVMADVVIPEDAADAVTPIDGVYDKPSRVTEQLSWLEDAGFGGASVLWSRRDVAIIVAEHR